ncbi:hypothetical protein D3C72_1666820 [compost metagenome]
MTPASHWVRTAWAASSLARTKAIIGSPEAASCSGVMARASARKAGSISLVSTSLAAMPSGFSRPSIAFTLALSTVRYSRVLDSQKDSWISSTPLAIGASEARRRPRAAMSLSA